MMRKCPRCHQEMIENCYLNDKAQPISDFVVIEKDQDFKKKEYPIKAAVCKKCGYLELYIDLEEK